MVETKHKYLKLDGAGRPVPQYYDHLTESFEAIEGVGGVRVGGHMTRAFVEFARPTGTAAYAAGDCVSNSATATTPLELPLGRVNGGSGYIVKLRLVTDQSACTASFRVWLYAVANPTLAGDNAPFTLLWANRASRVGYIDLSPMATEGAGSDSAAALSGIIQLPFVCAPDSPSLWAVLETKSAFTPASGQRFWLEAVAEVN